MADDDDLFVARLILGVAEGASDRGVHAEDGEEPRRRARADDALRGTGERQIEARILNRRHRLEARRSSLRIDEVSGGDVAGATAPVFVDGNNPVRFGQRQRIEHHRVHGAEDRRCGADAQRQSQHRERGESRMRCQLAEREA